MTKGDTASKNKQEDSEEGKAHNVLDDKKYPSSQRTLNTAASLNQRDTENGLKRCLEDSLRTLAGLLGPRVNFPARQDSLQHLSQRV